MSNKGQTQAAPSGAPPIPPDYDLERAAGDIDSWDQAQYEGIISTELTSDQRVRVAEPDGAHPRQREILAIHWHPEWVPMDLTARRVDALYPNADKSLIIPTQHNQILDWNGYSGVEVDCYSSGFNRKVQLLLHFKTEALGEAHILRSMLEHTFKYRSGQMFEFIDTIINPALSARLEQAANDTGSSEEVVAFTRFYTARLRRLVEMNLADTPAFMIKNKLLTEYIDAQRGRHTEVMVNRAQLLLKAVKAIVKAHFSLSYFFRASEVIEEARSLGGGVVIPHPEQFWPILLAEYDVDGVEVWNPQSREYTEFLIRALTNQNKSLPSGRRPMLIFMGDDTHMSVKLKEPGRVEPSKYEREVGLQPAWDDVAVRKSLSLAGASRSQVIDEYRSRLN
ncbi:hypothetical protein [Desulfoferula mesophila]|uniref:Uncharacterized protein n=1 Tax=Desulfoferula mesophila TaxID=3058419 RepID=A0AAU9EMV6_9BACT|nr:hypothetical protein FAK_15950 [Desulfoferula mesophilus]